MGCISGISGGIVVSVDAILGDNVNLSQCVPIGRANRGKRKEAARICNGVYIGPRAKIVGSVNIGGDIVIGANAVVSRDISSHAVAVGIPATVISFAGADCYVENRYEAKKP